MEYNESVKMTTNAVKDKMGDANIQDGEAYGFVCDWDVFKQYIRPALLPADRNGELLDMMPHRTFLDLAIVYIAHFSIGKMRGVMKIDRRMLKLWEIGEDELYQAALENMKEEHYEIRSLDAVIENMGLGLTLERETALGVCSMYVLSNKKNYYGAAGILEDSLLAGFSEKIQKNLYLLPASVHEFIIVPDDGKMDMGVLNAMVKSVNTAIVEAQDVLADHVYYFDREAGMIKIPGR